VAKNTAPQKHLKLYTERAPKKVRPQLEAVAALPELLRAFQSTTGWTMQLDPAASEEAEQTIKKSPNLQITKSPNPKGVRPGLADAKTGTVSNTQSPIPNPSTKDTAQRLADSIGELVGELLETRRVLWQREAELAAGVAVVPHREGQKHLAARLEAVLRAGAEAVGADAIGLYLLDESTTELKLRSSWGLPFDRLAAPARPLQGALADLEALLGHAVVLDDSQTMQTWNMPEEFPAAVCVPVSTPTMLLGTLWVFSNERRDFNDHETNIIEVVAGRLASDLEREMLFRAGADGATLKKQLSAAERMQQNSLPSISPLLDRWNVAGWTAQAEGVGGAFHDWFCLPQGLLCVAVGKAAAQSMAGALTASAVKTAVRAHAPYQRQAERILQQTNLTLWTGSAGDQHAGLFCGLVETATGRVCWASAGQISVLKLRPEGWQSLSRLAPSLGASPENDFEPFDVELQPGESLVIFSDSVRDAADSAGRPLGESGMAEALQDKLDLSAEELVVAAREALDAHTAAPGRHDLGLIVIKRTSA
jgi:phosphoserine phosphatase RsbU/P